MNTIISTSVIARLKDEVCPVHGQKAVIFADKDVLSITDACCPEFKEHLKELFLQLIGESGEPNALLEQMFGCK